VTIVWHQSVLTSADTTTAMGEGHSQPRLEPTSQPRSPLANGEHHPDCLLACLLIRQQDSRRGPNRSAMLTAIQDPRSKIQDPRSKIQDPRSQG